ncbi:MAG: hypothetical protein JNK14_17115 [Chitinophagaceae bacterium]|nr:hypothetical protein [Chitinophagaceae bacterium]
MRKISLWAKLHRPAAVISLIFIKLLLLLAAYFIGRSLQDMNIHIPAVFCAVVVILFISAIIFYPRRGNGILTKKQFYALQKSCDYAIALFTFIMATVLVNTNFTLTYPAASSATTSITTNPPTAEEILASLQYRDKKSLTRQEKRILKQEFKHQLKVFVKAKLAGKKDDSDKALLIILTIIGAVGLLFLVAALSCSIACNGAEGLAIAVAILGVTAIVLGVVAIIRSIKRGPRKRTEDLPKTDPTI